MVVSWLNDAFAAGCSKAKWPDESFLSEHDVNYDSNNDSGFVNDSASANVEEGVYRRQRSWMVEHQIRRRGIRDQRVLDAMNVVPRHLFVPDALVNSAYDDGPLPIGFDQTISQPYIVALMTELARPESGDRVLDVGTGCGYQAAVLAQLVQDVYSLEIIQELASQAEHRLKGLGCDNVHVRHGDGYRGWPEKAPFDIVLVAAAPDHVPQPLIDQLALGGRMVIPVGRSSQELKLIEKDCSGGVNVSQVAGVRFVPMTGEAEGK